MRFVYRYCSQIAGKYSWQPCIQILQHLPFFEENHHSLHEGILLGGSGYACQPFMMTPYSNPSAPVQAAYSTAHCKTRAKPSVVGSTSLMCCIQKFRLATEKVCIIVGAWEFCTTLQFFLKSQWRMKWMMLMMYIMVLIKDELCEIIFVAPSLVRLVPSFHHHFLYTLRDTVTMYLLKAVINSQNDPSTYVIST